MVCLAVLRSQSTLLYIHVGTEPPLPALLTSAGDCRQVLAYFFIVSDLFHLRNYVQPVCGHVGELFVGEYLLSVC